MTEKHITYRISPDFTLDDRRLRWQSLRASGPGGQHVNKVATAVQLRFDSAELPAWLRQRALARAGQRATKEGEIVLESSRYRSAQRNRDAARLRLAALLREAAHVPKARKKRRVSRAKKRQRVQAKRRRGDKKRLRRRPGAGD